MAGCSDGPGAQLRSPQEHDTLGAVIGSLAVGGEIGDAALMADGRIAIADRTEHRVVFAGPDGRQLGSVGRNGTGPGEYRDPRWVGRCGSDTLYVWDPSQRRLTVLDDQGHFARQLTLAIRADRISCNRSGQIAAVLLTDPRAEVRMRAASPELEGAVVLLGPAGDTLALIPQPRVYHNRPLGGKGFVALGDSTLYFGYSGAPWVRVYRLNGTIVDSMRVRGEPRSPTQRQYRAAIDEILTVLPNPSERAAFVGEMMAIPMPSSLPYFRQMQLDQRGRLWLNSGAAGDSVTSFYLLPSSGGADDVQVPGSWRLAAASDDAVVLIDQENVALQVRRLE